MAPINKQEVLEIMGSLGEAVPYLSPAVALLKLIVDALEHVQENKKQCFYLFKRSAILLRELNNMMRDKPRESQHFQNMAALMRALENVRDITQQLSKTKKLRRFLQRHDIAEAIKDAHGALDQCIELFQVQSIGYIGFSLEEFRAAEEEDQANLIAALETVQRNGLDILEALGIQRAETRDAIRGLQNNLQRGIENAIQRQFAEMSLANLIKQQGDPKLVPYEWAISELEIKVDDGFIGAGGFGNVFVGHWLGVKVAVKRLRFDTHHQILIKEIDIWRRLQHPHIAPFFRACIDSNPPFLVAEFYRYGNVLNYLADYPNANRVILSHEIALGMQFLHAQRIVHGDLKPANILIDNGRSARITDFGLSKIRTSQTSTLHDVNEPPPANIAGTKVFMAPERLRRGSLNFATDVYAYAMTLYQIFAGEAPFQYLPEEDLFRVVVEHGERPERPDGREPLEHGLSDQLWRLIEQCWLEDRTLRPDFRQITATLGSCISHIPKSSRIPRDRSSSPPEISALSLGPSSFVNIVPPPVHTRIAHSNPPPTLSATYSSSSQSHTMRSSPEPRLESMPPNLEVVVNDGSDFPCGIRRITNVKCQNLAVLSDGNHPSDVVAGIVENRANEMWIISRASNQRYFIKNHGYSSFAAHESGTTKDSSIVGVLRRQQWIIKETRVKGRYIISPSDNPDQYWALPDGELDTPVVLRPGATNERHQWTFS